MKNGISFDPSITSTTVIIMLVLPDRSVPASQAAIGWVYLDNSFDYPPCVAEYVLKVDGRETRWKVLLPDGISSKNNDVKIRSSDPYACEKGKEIETANRRFAHHLKEDPEPFSEEIFARRLFDVLNRGYVSVRKAMEVLDMTREELMGYLKKHGHDVSEL
jgi:hypothetical protein